MNNETAWMQQALALARAAAALGEVPVGAVVVHNDGRVLAACHNRVEIDQDPTAHAELLAIKAASAVLGQKRLLNCTLYVTLEPCTMCAGAIAHSRLARVVYAAPDEKGGGIAHGAKFFQQPTCHHRPVVTTLPACADEASLLLKDFFKAKR